MAVLPYAATICHIFCYVTTKFMRTWQSFVAFYQSAAQLAESKPSDDLFEEDKLSLCYLSVSFGTIVGWLLSWQG